MYIYGFYNFDYDDSTFTKLGHDKLFSKKGFEDIVNKCRLLETDNRKKAKEKLDKYLSSDQELSEVEADKLMKESSNLERIPNIENLLIKLYGFKELEPIHTFTFKRWDREAEDIEENKVLE